MHSFYLLKITLLETNPKVWRRFVVPSTITLDRLHDVIQIVMGWQESHLHEFVFKKAHYTENPEYGTKDQNEAFVRLNELLKRSGNTLQYVYDFGDDWRHEIVLEDKNYPQDDPTMPVFCTAGLMACPPEDSGGALGYNTLLEVLSDPDHEMHEETLEWIGLDGASAEEFSESISHFEPAEVNDNLAMYFRWSRERMLPLFEEEEY
ncbi:plasmid pRiA4b ORF-3 family protein [Dryocola sp. BD626]|uniref:plasmid pRiA4b ORF-3 family protein n=1 Tax=Dryocola sp. BD626 TaxID=3133273 RepID=UPI003F4FAF9D